MASAPPENDDKLHDKEFEDAFAEFAGGNKTPPQEAEEPQTDPPEGNDPEEQVASAPVEETAAPAEAPAEDVTSGQTAGAPAPAEKAPDPWAHLPQEARDYLAQVERERDEARHKAQSDANRVAALSRKLQQQSLQGSAPLQAPPEEQNEAKKALDDKVKQLRADYGDIADPLIELIEAQGKELNAVRSVVSEVATERQAAVIEAEARALEERHPDWRTVVQTPDFAGWLEVQPDNIQRLASSWDARESSVVLTLFKTERAEIARGSGNVATATEAGTPAAPDARRTAQLEAGREVRSRPAPASSGPPEDFDAAFEYFTKKRQKAQTR